MEWLNLEGIGNKKQYFRYRQECQRQPRAAMLVSGRKDDLTFISAGVEQRAVLGR
jgi:hypothetical protein